MTFTFVGTGLDIIQEDTVAGGSDTYNIQINGGATQSLSSTGDTTKRTVKIVSGLPYGTHTVKVNRVTASTFAIGVSDFIVYGPAKPALPANSMELGSYNIMADFVANTTAGLETISTGVLRKDNIREVVYTGSGWSVTGPSASRISGTEVITSSACTTFSYTFYGEGFDLRWATETARVSAVTVTIDGTAMNVCNFACLVTTTYGAACIGYTGNTLDMNHPCSVLGVGFTATGLSLSRHTVEFTKVAGTQFSFDTLDIITPIHNPKDIGKFALQATREIGSQALGDSRGFEPVETCKINIITATGVDTTVSTTSTAVVPLEDMIVHIKTSGKPIEIEFSAVATATAIGYWTLFVDGVEQLAYSSTRQVQGTNRKTVSNTTIIPVSAGTHTVQVFFRGSAGTVSMQGGSRNLRVKEML